MSDVKQLSNADLKALGTPEAKEELKIRLARTEAARSVMKHARTCNCGSGKPRHELVDAAGIFCAFVCDDCEPQKRSRYRREIFDHATRYAVSGDEEDIGVRISEGRS